MSEAEEPDRLDGAPHPRETVRLIGQDAAQSRFLAAAATGRMPHGWLLTGPRGVGKATLAWGIARHLIAGTGGLNMDPGHPLFRQTAMLACPSLFLCRRPWDDKTRRLRTAITVDEIRALKSFFQLSAAEGGWRVAIIDSADEMNPSAANALLKILEEPPRRAALLLISHQPARLLPTLRSRCRELRLAPLAAADLSEALAQAGAHPDAAQAAALGALADGSVGTAFRLLRGEGLAIHAEILELLSHAPGMSRPRVLALAESCAGRDSVERYDLVLELLRLALSRLARAAAGAPAAPVSEAEARAMARLARTPAQAQLWASHVAAMVERTVHARAVHLDPAQVILDTCLQIDRAASDALAHAA